MMATASIRPTRPSRHAGSALVVSLIMLLIVTMIGVVAARGASQQTRMAANMTDRALAFQAAEAALREAEKWVADLPPNSIPEPVATGTSPQIWDLTALFETEDVLGWDAERWALSGRVYSGTIAGVAAQPRFVIAYSLGGVDDAYFKAHDGSLQNQMLRRGVQNFMILARGVGGTADAEVVLQAHVRKSIDK